MKALVNSSPIIIVITLLALAGCTSVPADLPEAAAPGPTPELTLNLPSREARKSCDCQERDQTFLERGFAVLAMGDPEEALAYFERYKRVENSLEAQWEADMAITWVGMLSAAEPLVVDDAMRASYERLVDRLQPEMQVHSTTLLLRDAMVSMQTMSDRIAELEATNSGLREDLEKRDEAIKRLRDLTLGQSRATRP
ncbi:hypothetical protein CWI75_16435 [Kineobactrum sediminis]|uniref:Uncharacterized protein n=1 Tax=Kineobactrum sediminis TaxID=1905677 RepID=A0A2N5XYM4_9GAMM|nr:hypothetical protein [Kineobactrum sediminis]PLW81222.1 hypothetical protein CWI75_16435 [Kineobactrum sediminis]